MWLTFTSKGQLTHTFIPENGIAGGEVVPFFTLAGKQIFTPKEEEVVAFVRSFGLSAADAKDVIRRVGVA